MCPSVRKRDNTTKDHTKQTKDAESTMIEKRKEKSDNRTKGRTRGQKLRSWFLTHVLLVYFLSFATPFFVWNIVDAAQLVNVEDQLQVTLPLGFLVAATFTIYWNFILGFRGRMNALTKLLESRIEQTSKMNQLKPIEERLALRKPYLALSCCFALLGLTFSVFFLQSYRYPDSQFDVKSFMYFMLFVIFLSASLLQLLYYKQIVTNEEIAAFYIGRFLERLERRGEAFTIKDLSSGLRLYQKTLPPLFRLKSLNQRLRQIQLALDRASKTEYNDIVGILERVFAAMKNAKHEEFDIEFKRLIDFLDTFEESRKDIIEVSKITRKERIRAFFSPIAQPLVEKIIYALVAILIGALAYWIGINFIKIGA